jgi:polyhydroxyalkanoate synthesis regulator phasin
MAKRAKKVAKFGARIAAKAKQHLQRDLGLLVKSGIISRGEARKLAGAIKAEIKGEKERIKQFAKQELKRGLSKAKPLAKKAISRLRKAHARRKR